MCSSSIRLLPLRKLLVMLLLERIPANFENPAKRDSRAGLPSPDCEPITITVQTRCAKALGGQAPPQHHGSVPSSLDNLNYYSDCMENPLSEAVLNASTNAASLANLSVLDLKSKGFTSLPGLAACPRLSRLDLASNALQNAEVGVSAKLLHNE